MCFERSVAFFVQFLDVELRVLHFFLMLLYSTLKDTVVLSFIVNSGKWEDDKACGHGTLKYSNGDHYEGEWTDDQRNGKTSQEKKEKAKLLIVVFHYLSMSKSRIQGNGKFTSSETNITYSGSWRDGLKDGVGSLFFPSGDIITGRWKEVRRRCC